MPAFFCLGFGRDQEIIVRDRDSRPAASRGSLRQLHTPGAASKLLGRSVRHRLRRSLTASLPGLGYLQGLTDLSGLDFLLAEGETYPLLVGIQAGLVGEVG